MINELETQVRNPAVRAFERAIPHQAGTQLPAYARQAVESLNKGTLELSALNRRQQGGIRVGVSPLIASTVLPK